ncbi:hypothetical protein RFI_34203, partial [Reticulomyxa filosa]
RQSQNGGKEKASLIMQRCLNCSSLLEANDEEMLQMAKDIAGLSGLEKYKGDPQFQKLLQEYIVKCCEAVWCLLMNEKSGDRFSLFPTIFDFAAYQKCRETFVLPMNVKISYSFDGSWCKLLSNKNKAVTKEQYVFFVWPAIVKITSRGSSVQQE